MRRKLLAMLLAAAMLIPMGTPVLAAENGGVPSAVTEASDDADIPAGDAAEEDAI